MEFTRAPSRNRILIADDEPSVREVLADYLNLEGHHVEIAADGREALAMHRKQRFDLILSDMEMPIMSGLQLLREIAKENDPPLVIIMTGYGTVETAIDAMKTGAWDYLLKPFQINQLSVVVERAIAHAQIAAENIQLRASQALFEASRALIQPCDTQEDYIRILLEGCLAATPASAGVVWLSSPDAGEVVWQQRLIIDTDHILDWISPELFPSVHKIELMRFFQDPLPLLLDQDRLGLVFQEKPAIRFSAIITPIRSRDTLIGAMLLVSPSVDNPLRERDRKTVELLTSRAAASMHNQSLILELRVNVLETIEALVTALEAKDDYTKGHSLRVSRWAELIARQLNMSQTECEYVRLAGVLHDIGKIGINLTALNKPEKLSAEEYDAFKMHPVLSHTILAPISFLKPVLPYVLHHHERVDGDGYPLGLIGAEIPLGARIVAVADAFEVMVTDRVYRQALTLDSARSELARNRNSQFDGAVIDALLAVIAESASLDDLPVEGGRGSERDRSLAPPVGPYDSPVSDNGS